MKKHLYILIILPLIACQNNDESDIDDRGLTVVQGWLTDQDTIQFVKLSLSQKFLDNTIPEYIENAEITISGDNGDQLYLTHISEGLFASKENYGGKSGIGYTLTIILEDDQVITSTVEYMSNAPKIDTLGYDFYERESDTNPNIIEQVYYPITQIHDQANESNYYRWKLLRNDTLFSDPEYMILINDRFFDGNAPLIENEFTIFEYFEADSISLELHEISKSGFDYLRILKTQTTTLGSTSSITPGPINGNLHYLNSSETVLGFWGTSSVRRAGIKIIQ